MDFSEIINKATDGLTEFDDWCKKVYADNFEEHFSGIRELYKSLHNLEGKIPDEALATILIDVPLDLFAAAEALNRLKTHQEVVKLNAKLTTNSKDEKAATELVAKAYGSVISRAESEMSFSRELIMGAKKIWDSRRRSEETMPVTETDGRPKKKTNLPKYYIE